MGENLHSNNIKDDEFNLDKEDKDYRDLMTRLKEIKIIISLLGKKNT